MFYFSLASIVLANRTTIHSVIGYGIILSSTLNVSLSVTYVVHCGSQGWCTGLKVVPACSYGRHVLIYPFRHFCCRMYRSSIKCTGIKQEDKT